MNRKKSPKKQSIYKCYKNFVTNIFSRLLINLEEKAPIPNFNESNSKINSTRLQKQHTL